MQCWTRGNAQEPDSSRSGCVRWKVFFFFMIIVFYVFVFFRYCTDEQGRSAIEIVKASGGLPEMIAVLSGTKATSKNVGSGVGNGTTTLGGNSNNSGQLGASPTMIPMSLSKAEEKRFKKNKKKEKNAAAAAAASSISGTMIVLFVF